MNKELDYQEQAFVAMYLDGPKPFNAYQAALAAGYSELTAKGRSSSWVSVTNCPPEKRHVRDAIQSEMDRRFGLENIGPDWVLRRAKLLADFNIRKFLTHLDNGDAVYDFSEATDDDWYCIEEYVTEQSFRRSADGPVPVDKIKLKSGSKIAALKLLGEHISVQAFKQNVEVKGQVTTVTMTADEYKKARQEMIDADDC